MKIKKNVAPPTRRQGKYNTKYDKLKEAIKEMPIGSWIEVCFDEPFTIKHRNAIYVVPGNKRSFRLTTAKIDEYTMKIGKLPFEEE